MTDVVGNNWVNALWDWHQLCMSVGYWRLWGHMLVTLTPLTHGHRHMLQQTAALLAIIMLHTQHTYKVYRTEPASVRSHHLLQWHTECSVTTVMIETTNKQSCNGGTVS